MEGSEEVIAKFREVYKDLYNSVGTETGMNDIKDSLKNLINEDSLVEVNKITGEILKKACCRMKPNKADVSGSYTSDVFLHAPDTVFEHLAAVFRSFLVHGDVSLEMLR